MSPIPPGLAPMTHAEVQDKLARDAASRADQRSRFSRSVGQGWGRPQIGSSGTIAVVIHGADGTVGRPTAALVRWVGSATPDNAVAWDDWYDGDEFD